MRASVVGGGAGELLRRHVHAQRRPPTKSARLVQRRPAPRAPRQRPRAANEESDLVREPTVARPNPPSARRSDTMSKFGV